MEREFKVVGKMNIPTSLKETLKNRNNIHVYSSGKKSYKLVVGIRVDDKETGESYYLSEVELAKEGFQLNSLSDDSWQDPTKKRKKVNTKEKK